MSVSPIKTAMILAAGRGERMRPLTDSTPKPLLQVAGKSLIEWHLEKLVTAGFQRAIVNLHWLGEQIEEALGDGQRFGIELIYSKENPVLETAGGITKALPHLTAKNEEAFLVVNGDVWSDIDYSELCQQAMAILGAGNSTEDRAVLVMVDNPKHNPKGDFVLSDHRLVNVEGKPCLTYSGIGIYRPTLFSGLAVEPKPLGPILREAIHQDKLAGIHHQGLWSDVGTPERLEQLNQYLQEGR